jgi:hypothetical protein
MENLLLELALEPTESLAELGDRQEVPLLAEMRLPGRWYLSNRKSKDANKNERYGVGVSTMTLLALKVVEVAR